MFNFQGKGHCFSYHSAVLIDWNLVLFLFSCWLQMPFYFKYLSNICQFPSKRQFFIDRFSTIFLFRSLLHPKGEVWKRIKKVFERWERTWSFLNFREKIRDAGADPDQEYQAERRKKKAKKTSIFVQKTVKCLFLAKNDPRKFVDFQANGSFF